jgi:hypothetical protein
LSVVPFSTNETKPLGVATDAHVNMERITTFVIFPARGK